MPQSPCAICIAECRSPFLTRKIAPSVATVAPITRLVSCSPPSSHPNITATSEKLSTAPAWRGPWQRGRRCIIPADGFYEWHAEPDGRKQPFLIEVSDQVVFGFAGLWDGSRKEDGTVIRSCAIVTMAGNALMRDIHNTGKNPYRMPAILRPEDHAAWLSGTAEEAKSVLLQYPDDRLHAYRVSTRVNAPKNDDASLIEPLQSASS